MDLEHRKIHFTTPDKQCPWPLAMSTQIPDAMKWKENPWTWIAIAFVCLLADIVIN